MLASEQKREREREREGERDTAERQGRAYPRIRARYFIASLKMNSLASLPALGKREGERGGGVRGGKGDSS